MWTHKELINAKRDLPLRSSEGDLIASLFSAGEDDLAVPLLLHDGNI